jgi:hypothetical protein
VFPPGRPAGPDNAAPRGAVDDPLTTTGSGRRRLDELTTTTTGVGLRRADGATGSLTAVRPAADVLEGSRWRGGPHTRLWQAVVGVLGVIALLVTCGFFSWRVLQDERTGQGAQAATGAPTATAQPRDISSREVDPEPLTVDEVFGEEEIPINPADPPYRVLGTQAEKDCSVAAADALAELLDEHGCSQVVRATLRSPDKDYLITGGVFNLKTEDGALEAYEGISPLIEEGTGRFLGLLAGDGTEPIVLSSTQLGWDYRGHYLIYTVIARADGAEFAAADDREAELIIWDIAEIHLRTNVLDKRAIAPAGGTPPPTGEPTGGPAED